MQINHSENIIEIKNLSFSYGQEEILSNINLNIHKRDYLGIIGPNGAGKTTLLKIILGLLKPKTGNIILFGKPIEMFKDWTKIGYVAQKAVNFDQNFPLTVSEVVAMGRVSKRGLFKSLTQEDEKIIIKSLEQVEMWEYRDRIIGDLSGGQQQRIFIARALAGKPEVIFLDEPTAGIDTTSQEQFYRLLKKMNKEIGLTLILISHDIEVISHEVTEIACINKKLVYEGNPKGLLSHKNLREIYGKNVTFITHTH